MLYARLTIHLPSAFALMLALALPAAATEVDDARAAYVAALVDSMRTQDSLIPKQAALTAAEDDLAATLSEEQQALTAALVGPQAALLAAEDGVRGLAAQAKPVSPRVAALTTETALLKLQREAAASAAADRVAAMADLQAEVVAAIYRQRITSAALAAAQADLAAAEAAQLDFAPLKALATTGVGLRDQQLRSYVWSTFAPQDLVSAVRDTFLSAAAELVVKDGANQDQARWSMVSGGWRFDDVPQGDAWLLWNTRTDAPLDLIERRDDIFDQPVFLRVPVSKDTVVDSADLQRVDIDNVEGSVWPISGGSPFDACLDRLAPANDNGAIRQLCQTLFSADARYDVSVRDDSGGPTVAVLLSGAQARAFVELYRSHLAELRGLAAGDVPVLLLPLVKQKIDEHAEKLALQVAQMTGHLASAETNSSAATADLTRRQQAQAAAVAAKTAYKAAEDSAGIAISAQLTALQEELVALKAQDDRAGKSLVARQAAAVAAVDSAKQAVTSVRTAVQQDWAARRQQADSELAAAQDAFTTALSEDEGVRQGAMTELNRFLAMLASSKIQKRVYFDLSSISRICMSVQNNSDLYAVLDIGGLRFHDQPFTQVGALDMISDGDYVFQEFRSGQAGGFTNKYSEPVLGLRPNQKAEECSFINDPKIGELGRYFDGIGGFSESGWDVDLGVKLGTFADTEKAIAIVSNDIIFADDLAAVMDAAALASRSNQDAAAAPDGSVTVEDPPDASAERAPEADQPTIGEFTAREDEAPGVLAELDAPSGTESAADVVLDLDRELGREVQAALNAAGFAVGRPDGLIGTRSQKAIADWQATHGHAATGALTRSQASNLLGRSVP